MMICYFIIVGAARRQLSSNFDQPHVATTLCPRKNYNTVYVAITLANNVRF